MDDKETLALTTGRHTFEKCLGAAGGEYIGPAPEDANIEEQGRGWKSDFASGKGEHTITSGVEDKWTTDPTTCDNDCFDVLLGYDWELTKSPFSTHHWSPTSASAKGTVLGAHSPAKSYAAMMKTADMALKLDPTYVSVSKYFHENPEFFADVSACDSYALTHRDMGPISRYLSNCVPSEELVWQDPVPTVIPRRLNL